jgi:hypothetical protein
LWSGALVVQQGGRWRQEEPKGAKRGIVDTVLGVWPFSAMVRPQRDVSVQEALEGIEASGRRHRRLLDFQRGITLASEAAIGNLEPLAKPKLELL